MFSERECDYLMDIVADADRLIGFVEGMNADVLAADERTSLAVERLFQRITEAVFQLGAETMARIDPDLPLANIRNFGNRLRHDYRNIDPHILLQTAREYLPALRDTAARALEADVR